MPSSPNQKMKLLYLMKILTERTDENHVLTIQQIIEALAEYDIQAERKSLYSDIRLLRRYGLDIETRKTKTFGYYVASRSFEQAKQLSGMFGGEPVNATLRFHQSLTSAVLDQFGTHIPLHKKGDSIEIHVEVSNSPVFLGWIFQFGGKAEIVAPESLRTSMAALIAEHARLYR